MIELILGGTRSGKSTYAQQSAIESGLPVIYVATASGDDAEMRDRIRRHQQDRPAHWQLIEEPVALARVLQTHATDHQCLLVDCLTLWLSNLLCLADEEQFQAERKALLQTLAALPGRIILVSNETGLGVIPMGELSRRFCDEAGVLHQQLAMLCDSVTFMVAGLAQKLK